MLDRKKCFHFLLSSFRYSANEFCTGEHVGTHLDAPYHFNKNGETVEQIPITKLIAKGLFFNACLKFLFKEKKTHIYRYYGGY